MFDAFPKTSLASLERHRDHAVGRIGHHESLSLAPKDCSLCSHGLSMPQTALQWGSPSTGSRSGASLPQCPTGTSTSACPHLTSMYALPNLLLPHVLSQSVSPILKPSDSLSPFVPNPHIQPMFPPENVLNPSFPHQPCHAPFRHSKELPTSLPLITMFPCSCHGLGLS